MFSDQKASLEFSKIRERLFEELPYFEKLIDEIRYNKEPRHAVYSFQALMDGLNSLKERADQITAIIDHG